MPTIVQRQAAVDFNTANRGDPVRPPLGSDTAAAIEAKHAADAAILGEWHSLSVATDFAAADAV